MRDPQRLMDDKQHSELQLLILAAKHDGPPRPAEAKQRVKAAVFAHMRARDNVRQSGVRRIGSIAGSPIVQLNAVKLMAPKPPRQTHSWADRAFAWMAMAAAFVVFAFVIRQAYMVYAEQPRRPMLPRNVDLPVHDRLIVPEDNEIVEHRASITVIEEPAPVGENEINATEPDDIMPPRELVLKLKHRASRAGTPQILIRSSCSDPNDWRRNVDIDYPTEAYNAGISGTMNVGCNLNAEGSFSGCVAQRPPGFTAVDTGRVIMAMNSWTLSQSMRDWTSSTRRCKIEVIFDLGNRP